MKRLIISILAASTIALAGLSNREEFRLSVLYVLVASLIVWLPVAVYLVSGNRADGWVSSSKESLVVNQRRLMFLTSLVLGLLFLVDALIQLA